MIVIDQSRSESIGQCRRVQGGLILCYAQALGVVDVGSLGVKGYAAVVPPVMPLKGRTTVSGVVIGFRGESDNRPKDQRVHK